MRIRHYYAFGNKILDKTNDYVNDNDVNWDLLRQNGSRDFALPKTRDEYIRDNQYDKTSERFARIICDGIGVDSNICSVGCGKAAVEWWIKQMMPEIKMCCSDCTGGSIEQLKLVFPECDDYLVHDVSIGFEEIKDYNVILMHRISTEFNEDNWKHLFQKAWQDGIQTIIFVPARILHLKDILFEVLLCIRWILQRKKLTFAGWEYSRHTIEGFWEKYYDIRRVEFINNTGVYFIDRKEG